MKNAYKIRFLSALLIFFLIILAFCCHFYPVYILNLQFIPLVSKVLIDFSAISLLCLFFLAGVTFIFGRFYCSSLCPFGTMQEIFALIFQKSGKKIKACNKNLWFKYIIAVTVFGMLLGGSSALIRMADPYSIFGKTITGNISGIIVTALVLILVFFKNRFFCTNICPVGAILGLFSKYSLHKINIDDKVCLSCKMCERNCPSGCIDISKKTVDNEICIKCLKCISNCHNAAIKYCRSK